MESWVFSDCDDLTERVQKSLLSLGIRCTARDISSLQTSLSATSIPAADEDIVFLAVSAVSGAIIETLQRVKSATKATLVVVSFAADNPSILGVIRAGASDFIEASSRLTDEIRECVARIASERSRSKSIASVISIVPCHVSSDASILAANVSAVIAKQFGSCCLLDLQLRGGDLALLLKLAPRHNLHDLLNQCQSIDRAVFRQALTPHESGIHLLAGPELFTEFQGLQSHLCEEIINQARSEFSHVVIATEDIHHSEQIYALTNSSHILVTMRLDVMSLHRAKCHIDFLSQHDIIADHIHVVAMGSGLSGELSVSAVQRVLRVPVVHRIPDSAAAFTASINVGNPLVLEAPKSKPARAIANLVTPLVDENTLAKTEGIRTPLSAAKAAAVLAVNTLTFLK